MTSSADEGPVPDKLRRRIAAAAARQVTGGADSRRATFRAARRVARGWVEPDRLPDVADVHREVLRSVDAPRSLARVAGDRFDRIAALVAVLETVRQDPVRHPEGDALEHTLQVFDLVHRERPYDEELLTAALVHDAGLAIDRAAPVEACLAALGDLVTPRTRWLVEMLPTARSHADRSLGQRARQRLQSHPDFADVTLLADADRRGRVRGYDAPTLDAAIGILRDLAAEDDGG